MQSYKPDFPIFAQDPWLIFLDSAASTQKPSYVIDNMADFLRRSYANIHRGSYSLSEKAEDIYYKSKEKYASVVWFSSDEIIYTYNATYAYNLLTQTLRYSGVLKEGDVVLVDIAEHHANLVPWQMLSERHGIIIEWIDLDANFEYDMDDFKKKYIHASDANRVKVVSISAASNVTGRIYNLEGIASLLRPETFFVVDGSQAIPHVSVADYACNARIDALIATGHKIMSDTGIGMLALRKPHIKALKPARGGWGMIDNVTTQGYTLTSGWEKFEPGTPHIVGSASLLFALEYIESIGGYPAMQKHENQLIEYALDRIHQNNNIDLFGPTTTKNRLGIFSFRLKNQGNAKRIWEMLANENICIRCWWHCTHPLFQSHGWKGACRISTYIYNDIADLEKTFDALENIT